MKCITLILCIIAACVGMVMGYDCWVAFLIVGMILSLLAGVI
jgi:hypothetical protein